MRVLVIGGTLFLGRGLVRALLDRGHDVTILHRGRQSPFAGRTAEVHCDRNDEAAIGRILRQGAYEAVFDNVYDWARGTTAEQVGAAARACGDSLRRYIFTSSVAAYAEGLDRDEDDPLVPDDCPDSYSRNKAQSERLLLGMHRDAGFPAVTLRPPYIYGPENPFEREQFFWDRMLRDRPVIVPGDGRRLMHLVHRDDYVRAAMLALETPAAVGRAYNVAHAAPVTQAELVRALARAAGREARLVLIDREKLLALGGNLFEPPFYFGQYYDMPPVTQKIDRPAASWASSRWTRTRACGGLSPGIRRSIAPLPTSPSMTRRWPRSAPSDRIGKIISMRSVIFLFLAALCAHGQEQAMPTPPQADLPYLIFPGGRLVPTEASVAVNISDKKLTKYAIEGATSGVQTPLALPEFAFLAGEIEPSSIELYGFEVVGGRREITLAKKDKPLVRPYHITPLPEKGAERLYRIRVASGLPKGEHCLTPRTSDKVFCFTVF